MKKVNAEPDTVDVAVVGGGVTGLYLAWKLGGADVRLYEGSNRVGGRVETVKMGDPDGGNKIFNAEFGPMRYEKEGQQRLMRLLAELGIETVPFPTYSSSKSPWPKYDLKGEEERWKDAPLDLLLMGILKVLGKYENGMSRDQMIAVASSYKEEDFPDLRKNGKCAVTGRLLHKYGLWNVLSGQNNEQGEVLSHQAVLKIRDTGNFYHVVQENPNAVEWMIFWLRAHHKDDTLVGLQGGSSMLTDTLHSKIKEGVIRKEHRLVSFEVKDDRVHLEFEHGNQRTKVSAEHAILALPQGPLVRLAASLPEAQQKDLDTVRGIPLLKIFFVVKNPWWDEETSPHTNAAHMPVREVHYYREQHAFRLEEKRRKLLEDNVDRPVPTEILLDFGRNRHELPSRAVITRSEKDQGWWVLDVVQRKRICYIAKSDLSVYDRRKQECLGMVMVYTDRPASEYWNLFVVDRENHDRAEMRKSPELQKHFFRYLARELANQLEEAGDDCPQHLEAFQGMSPTELTEALVERVVDWGIHDWEHAPYNGAFHIWRPKARSWEVIDRLKAFGPGNRLHVAGEAFSDHQGFIEGCLQTADLALETLPKEWLETSNRD